MTDVEPDPWAPQHVQCKTDDQDTRLAVSGTAAEELAPLLACQDHQRIRTLSRHQIKTCATTTAPAPKPQRTVPAD